MLRILERLERVQYVLMVLEEKQQVIVHTCLDHAHCLCHLSIVPACHNHVSERLLPLDFERICIIISMIFIENRRINWISVLFFVPDLKTWNDLHSFIMISQHVLLHQLVMWRDVDRVWVTCFGHCKDIMKL